MASSSKADFNELTIPHGLRAGVIDIGSNAIRLLIGNIETNGVVKKLVKIREPIRLGGDVFTKKIISKQKISSTINAFKKFVREFERNEVEKVRAVATSAVREADNKDSFVEKLYEETGIAIDVIGFEEESDLILNAVVSSLKVNGRRFVLMDIGGGSVEFILAQNGRLLDSISLPLGTVRLLDEMSAKPDVRPYLEEKIQKYLPDVEKFFLQSDEPIQYFVGTGGNMECLGQLRRNIFKKTSNSKIKSHELDYIVEELFLLSPERRMQRFSLRSDRNDVILPASLLSQKILKTLGLGRILLPGVGLREGVLLDLATNPDSH